MSHNRNLVQAVAIAITTSTLLTATGCSSAGSGSGGIDQIHASSSKTQSPAAGSGTKSRLPVKPAVTGLAKQPGQVVTWGNNHYGQACNGTSDQIAKPTPIKGLDDVIQVSTGRFESYFLKADGTVWACGAGDNGALGDGVDHSVGTNVNRPQQIPGLNNIVSIRDSSALGADGSVWIWGPGTGKVVGSTEANVLSPKKLGSVPGGRSITDYAVLDDTGQVWTFGSNYRGNLGVGNDDPEAVAVSPARVSGLKDTVFIDGHSAIDSEGTAWIWGSRAEPFRTNSDDNSEVVNASPKQLTMIKGLSQIVLAGSFSVTRYVLKTDGTVWAWGFPGRYGSSGALGANSAQFQDSPVKVAGLKNIVSISGGGQGGVGYAIDSSGALWGWGDGRTGAFGDGLEAPSNPNPVIIAAAGKTLAIASGTGVVAAIRSMP